MRSLFLALWAGFLRAATPSRRPSSLHTRLRVEELEKRELLATLLWQGMQGNLNWSTPNNWVELVGNQPGQLATVSDGDTLLFTNASGKNSVVDQSYFNITLKIENYEHTLTINENVNVSIVGGQFTSGPESNLAGKPTLTGAGDLTLKSGDFLWTRGTMSGSGQTTVAAGAQLTIHSSSVNGQDARLAGRLLRVNGVGPTPSGFAATGKVVFDQGRLYLDREPNPAVGQPIGTRVGRIENSGEFLVTGTAEEIATPVGGFFARIDNRGAGEFLINLDNWPRVFTIQSTFNNNSRGRRVLPQSGLGSPPSYTGGVQIQRGNLVLTGGGESSGTFETATDVPGKTHLQFTNRISRGASYTWKDGVAFNGLGGVAVSDLKTFEIFKTEVRIEDFATVKARRLIVYEETSAAGPQARS